MAYSYCPECGEELTTTTHEGEQRLACPDPDCGFVHFDNPTPVVAAIVERDGHVVLVQNREWPDDWYALVSWPWQHYRFSVRVRGEGLESEPFVQVLFDDADEELLADQTFRPDGATDQWVEIAGVTRVAPAETETLRFNLAVDGTDGPVWWDAAGLFSEQDDGGRDAGMDTGTDGGSGEAPPEHELIGGGSAYVEYLEDTGEPTFCGPSSGDEVVSTASVDALEDALGRAGSGDVVYVEGDLEIDMGFDASVDILSGVTLASNRGCGGAEGARLYTDDKPDEQYTPRQMFEPTNDDIRLTGLRLEGPYETSDELHPLKRLTNLGIEPDSVEGLEIDNVEMFNFMWAAIRAGDSVVHLHHSYIHHNNQNGLGYGITAPDWGSVIEYNRFDYNRHGIAGGGEPPEGYVARYNVFGDSCLNSQQRMDQHGHPDDGDTAGKKWRSIAIRSSIQTVPPSPFGGSPWRRLPSTTTGSPRARDRR